MPNIFSLYLLLFPLSSSSPLSFCVQYPPAFLQSAIDTLMTLVLEFLNLSYTFNEGEDINQRGPSSDLSIWENMAN